MNMKPATLVFALLATPFSGAFACDVPVAPPTPDGGSATMEDMVASQGEVKAFQAANGDYLTCVDDQMTAEKAAMDEGDKMLTSAMRWRLTTTTRLSHAKSK